MHVKYLLYLCFCQSETTQKYLVLRRNLYSIQILGSNVFASVTKYFPRNLYSCRITIYLHLSSYKFKDLQMYITQRLRIGPV